MQSRRGIPHLSRSGALFSITRCRSSAAGVHSTRTPLTWPPTASPMPAAAPLPAPAERHKPRARRTALQRELAGACMQYFTLQHWLKAIFSFCTISALHTRLLLNAQIQQQTASGSAKKHSVLSCNSLQAPQSKHMLLSALLTVQNTPDQIKHSGESMPFSKLGAYTLRLPNYKTATSQKS